jgi:hypothetical protein
MSSFFDEASLVMIPSGYKDQKVYSVKPLDGSGDLTFSRASNATRVASNGLIEKVRTNLILYSEQFNDAYWSKFQATITANSTTAPNGTLTADTITDDANSGSHVIFKTAIWNTTSQTFSIFAKAGTSSRVCILNNSLGTGVFANLADSTIVVDSGFVGTLTAVGNGWFRITAAHTAGSSQTLAVGLFTGTSTVEYIGTGSTAFLWGAQLETGDIATDYIATTTTAVSVGPVSGLPRLDYLNSTCPRLLLEPQRSNLSLYSEQLGTASYWFANNSTVTSNNAVSPDGYTNADMYTAAGSGNYLNASAISAGSNTVTFSVFAKAGTAGQFRIREAFYYGTNTVFNLATGTIISGTGTITNYGNGWYRCTHTQTYAAGETSVSWSYDLNGATSGTAYLYGAQVEVGAYATSYIPTLGTSVTRVADECNKTSVSSLIGQTEGTLFAEFYWDGNPIENWLLSVQTSASNFVAMFLLDDGRPYFYILNSGSVQMAYIGTALSVGYHKFAFGYAANNSVAYIDGVLKSTDTSCTIPATSEVRIGSVQTPVTQAATIKQAIVFPTRLSNSDLAALTA